MLKYVGNTQVNTKNALRFVSSGPSIHIFSQEKNEAFRHNRKDWIWK